MSLKMNPQKEPNLRSAKIKAAYPTFRKDANLISLVFYGLGAVGISVAVISLIMLFQPLTYESANGSLFAESQIIGRLFGGIFFGGLFGVMCIALGKFIRGISRMMVQITDSITDRASGD